MSILAFRGQCRCRPFRLPITSTRPVNSWSPLLSPTRSSRIPPRIKPGFARCWRRNPVVRSIPPAGLAQNRRTARLSQAIRSKPKGNGKQRTARYGRRYAQPRPKDGQRTNSCTLPDGSAPSFTGTYASAPKRGAPSRSAGDGGALGPPTSRHRERSSRRSSRPAPRVCVCTSRANTDNGTNDGTHTDRAGQHGPAGNVTEGR